MRLTVNWRNEILKCWGIHILNEYNGPLSEALWVSRCSETKNSVSHGIPKQLYVSPINRYFYRCMETKHLPYGVLSDKYGLHMHDEELAYYDTHPSELTESEKRTLGAMIREKVLTRGFGKIIFYNPAPLMSIPYFQMLYYASLDAFYTTTLRLMRLQPSCSSSVLQERE